MNTTIIAMAIGTPITISLSHGVIFAFLLAITVLVIILTKNVAKNSKAELSPKYE